MRRSLHLRRNSQNAWWAPGVRTFLRSRSGILARLIRNPIPGSEPWRRKQLDVARNGGIGDVLLCTPALRELKRKNPECRVRFYTRHPSLVRGLPYVDLALPYAERPSGAIYLQYEDAIPPRVHFAKIIGDNLGLDVKDVRPDCVIDPKLVAFFRKSWRQLPRPHIIVQRRGSRWTPNKNWPLENWQQLINALSRNGTVLEIGHQNSAPAVNLESYVDLRGQSLEEALATIAAGDIFVGPPSGPAHVAAAAGVLAVIIIGGYELPDNSAYSGTIGLHTSVQCSPCWLREPCPHQLKCLTAIEPAIVKKVVLETLAAHKFASANDATMDRSHLYCRE